MNLFTNFKKLDENIIFFPGEHVVRIGRKRFGKRAFNFRYNGKIEVGSVIGGMTIWVKCKED